MTKAQHKAMRHALMAADNALHEAMRERGFEIYHDPNDTRNGLIYDAQDKSPERWPLARYRLEWVLEKIDKEA